MTASLPSSAEAFDALMRQRQHIGPKHLGLPAPDAPTLRAILAAAGAAPDHHRVRPWRFIVLGAEGRARLGGAFEAALVERDAGATPEQRAEAHDKAMRGAVLVLAIAVHEPADTAVAGPRVPDVERLTSFGCALQNVLLAATARGYDSGVTSGQSMRSVPLRQAMELADNEEAVCFITLGTATKRKPPRERPTVDEYVRAL